MIKYDWKALGVAFILFLLGFIMGFVISGEVKKCPTFKPESVETRIAGKGDTLVVFYPNKPVFLRSNKPYILIWNGKDSIVVWQRLGAFEKEEGR